MAKKNRAPIGRILVGIFLGLAVPVFPAAAFPGDIAEVYRELHPLPDEAQRELNPDTAKYRTDPKRSYHNQVWQGSRI